MFTRRFLIAGLAGVVLVAGALAAPGSAAERVRYTQAAFDAAVADGRPVLIDVYAPWCPVCRTQKPILSDVLAQPKFARLALFEIDFDTQKDVLRKLRVQQQSTLIVFKSGAEVGRSVGDTDRGSIAALLDRAI